MLQMMMPTRLGLRQAHAVALATVAALVVVAVLIRNWSPQAQIPK